MQYRDETKNLVRDFGFSRFDYFSDRFISSVNVDNPLEISSPSYIYVNIDTSDIDSNACIYLVGIEFLSSYVETIDYNYTGYTFHFEDFRYNNTSYAVYPISASFESIRRIVSVYVESNTRRVTIDCDDAINFRDMNMLHITCLCMAQVTNFT